MPPVFAAPVPPRTARTLSREMAPPEVFEKAARRPLKREVSYAFSAVGTALLFSLIFYLMYADVVRYIVKG